MVSVTDFTTTPVSFLHIDINSCFATIEQQANPSLRGKPTVVVARNGPSGCVLAASYEAKRLGIGTGTRLREAVSMCPVLNVLLPDPDKYRFVHKKLKKLLLKYTHLVSAWSIDEFNLNLTYNQKLGQNLVALAHDIKLRLKTEVGDYITVSIGLAPNSYLAKTAASLQKPDGLKIIDKDNFLSIYSSLKITDLCGISHRLATHLYPLNITTVSDLYQASLDSLRSALGPAAAHYWHLRLRGFQVVLPNTVPKSFGHSYVLSTPLLLEDVLPILNQLLQKACLRLRNKNLQAQGLSLYLGFKDFPSFNQSLSFKEPFFDDSTAWQLLKQFLETAPHNTPIKSTALTLFNLSPKTQLQLNFFSDRIKQSNLSNALDKINTTYGNFTIGKAPAFFAKNSVPDSIGFGRIRELT